AVEHVLGVAPVTERLDVLVDDVVPRRGCAPRVVLAAAELDVRAGAGERRPPGIDSTAVEVSLVEHLRVEVADLWPGHEKGMPVARAARADQQSVAGLGRHGVRAR